MARSIIEVLDPHARSQALDRNLKIEIERARLSQRENQHREQMALYEQKIQLDRENNNQKIQLERENNEARNYTTIEAEKIRERASLELARLNHRHEMAQISQKAHLDYVNSAGSVAIQGALSQIARGEEQSRAVSNAIAKAFEMRTQSRLDEAMEDKREAYRERERQYQAEEKEKERQHQIKMELLKNQNNQAQEQNRQEFEIYQSLVNAGIHRANFTHDEVLKLVLRLADPSQYITEEEEELFDRFTKWSEKFWQLKKINIINVSVGGLKQQGKPAMRTGY